MNESDILQKVKQGNAAVFEFLFREYYQSLCHFALKYVKDSHESEELVQETFVKIWNRREQISIEYSLKAYLYQSVRNACLNYLKHQQVKKQYEQTQLYVQQELRSVDIIETMELEKKISDSLEKLPSERKKVFLMNRNQGLKYREIAEKLGISIKTVENQMGKALKFLREELQEYLIFIWLFLIELLKNIF